jgi:hypothetical protein
MPKEDIIQGNKFKDLCDFQLHTIDDIGAFSQIRHNFAGKVKLIYLKTDYIHEFFDLVMPDLGDENQFILITHNSDGCVGSEWLRYSEDQHVIKWFAQNCTIDHPKVIPIPIGIANSEFEHGNIDVLHKAMMSKKDAENKLYVNLSETHEIRRKLLEHFKTHANPRVVLEKNRLSYAEYLEQLKSFQFSCAPRGNGPDTHRLWELYYLQNLPVTYDTLFQSRYAVPQHYLPFLDSSSWELEVPDEKVYATRIRDIGRLHGRMSYWEALIRQIQTTKPYLDVVIFSDAPLPDLYIDSIFRYIHGVKNIYIIRSKSITGETMENDRIKIIVNESENSEILEIIPEISEMILCVDARLCFTSYIHFETFQGMPLYSTNRGRDEKYGFASHLKVEEAYHSVYHTQLLKTLAETEQTNAPLHVMYFHTFKKECKIRNLFTLVATTQEEFDAARVSNFYRFAVAPSSVANDTSPFRISS